MRLLLIDTHALLYRLYHALPRLTDPSGKPIQAVYGLANVILKIIDELKPDFIFACYDRPEPTFRHQAFKEYKAQRPAITDDFKIQIPIAKKLLEAFNIPVIEYPGYEADDLIATLKNIFYEKVSEIIILTGDLDTLQLIDSKTNVYLIKKGVSEIKIYDENEVEKRFGILPNQITDFKSLVGDPSDNIKGIAGVGEKTAAKLLQKYQTLEDIISASEKGLLEPSLRSKILDAKERLIFQKNLLTLKKDVPLEIKIDKFSGIDYQKLFQFFQAYGFKSLLKRIEPFIKEKSVPTLLQRRKYEAKSVENLPKLKENLFTVLEDNKIYLFLNNEVYILPNRLQYVKDLFLFEGHKYFWDTKPFWKILLQNDWYLDQKINLETIFDLKILFWLIEPHLGRYKFQEAVNFLIPKSFAHNLLDAFEFFNEFKEKIEEKIKFLNLNNVYSEIERPLTPVLARMELMGIKIDQNKIKELKSRCLIEIQALKKEIENLAGVPFNPLSPKELNYILFQKLKLPSKGLAKTKKGEISTQESELLKIIDAHPIVPKILDYRKLVKVASTYTDSLLVSFDPKDGRVHPVYNQTGTSTGRLSSENPNVQNIPLKGELADLVREAFIAEEGFLFLGADYSQLELRLAAHLSQDENLLAAFKNNLDIHSQTAKLVFGEENLETRRLAKAINFGIIYGMQAKGLAERLRIPISQAQKIIERYFHFYPGLKKMREDLIEKAKIYGYAETLSGRKLSLPEIYSNSYREKSEAERIAVNMPIQGLGADIIKKAMIAIDRALYEEFIKEANLILSIHDELVLEVKEEKIDAISKMVKEKMENAILLSLPLEVKIKEGRNLLEIKK
jgi:DNA polymerase-1